MRYVLSDTCHMSQADSCRAAKIPSSDINKKIMDSLVRMVRTEPSFKMRIRYFSLAANIAVTDGTRCSLQITLLILLCADSVFCSEDARTLGEVWIEGFLSENMLKLEGDSRWLLYLIPGSLFQLGTYLSSMAMTGTHRVQ